VPEPVISVIAPVYNEEECLPEFYDRVTRVLKDLGLSYEVIFVDDGSIDSSPEILRGFRTKDPLVRVLRFSRNFGHQIALKAGIDHAAGQAVISIDADLQDPPEIIPEFLKKWHEGFDVVYAFRVKREGETLFKKWTAFLFYRLLRAVSGVDLPVDAGDFRLISRRVADKVREVKRKNLYLRGLIAWMGYKQAGVPIHREARFAGKTKYSLRKMLGLALSGFIQFSPLGRIYNKEDQEPLYLLRNDAE